MTLRNGYPKGDKSFMPEKIVGVLGGMGPEATVDFFAKAAEGFAGLGPGIIEFACLPDNNRPGPYNHHFFDIVPFGHTVLSYI